MSPCRGVSAMGNNNNNSNETDVYYRFLSYYAQNNVRYSNSYFTGHYKSGNISDDVYILFILF